MKEIYDINILDILYIHTFIFFLEFLFEIKNDRMIIYFIHFYIIYFLYYIYIYIYKICSLLLNININFTYTYYVDNYQKY